LSKEQLVEIFFKENFGLCIDFTMDDRQSIENILNKATRKIKECYPIAPAAVIEPERSTFFFDNANIKHFLACLPDAIVATDAAGIMRFFSLQAEVMFGYKAGEVVGKPISILMDNRVAQYHTHLVQRYFDQPSTRFMGQYNKLMHGKRKDGSEFPVEIGLFRLEPAVDGYAVAMIRDISQRTLLEKEVVNRELKLRQLTDAMPGILYQYRYTENGEVQFLFVSSVAESILGVSPESLIRDSRTIFSKVHPDDRNQLFSAIAHANAHQTTLIHTFRIINNAGEIRWLQVSSRPEETDGETRTGSLLDITESKEAENKLKNIEAFNKAMLDTTPNQVALVSGSGEVLQVNKSWLQFSENHGITLFPRVGVGKNFLEACMEYAGEDLSTVEDVLRRMERVSKGTTTSEEFQYQLLLQDKKVSFVFRILRVLDGSGRLVISHSDITNIIKLEEESRQKDDKYRQLLATTDEMINTVSKEGKILWANTAWKQNLQYDDTELGNLSLSSILSQETTTGYEERLKLLMAGKVVKNIEGKMKTKGGTFVDVLGTVVPLYEKGEYVGTQGFFRDVTQYNKEKNERIKANARLQNVLEHMSIGAIALNHDLIIVSCNASATGFFFSDTESVVGKPIGDIPYLELNGLNSKFRNCVENSTFDSFEKNFRNSDGTGRWFEFKINPDQDGLFILVADITKRKKIEENLQKSRKLLADAQKIAKIGSWELDFATGEYQWSDEIFSILELKRGSVEPHYKEFLKLVHPEDRQGVHLAYTKSVQDKTVLDIRHRLLMPDGKIKHLHEQVETIYDSNQNPIRSIGSCQDVTSEVEAELRLRKNEIEYKRVVENISDAILIDDREGNVVFANERFLELFRFEREDLSTLRMEDYIVPESRRELRERHDARVAGADVETFFEYEGLRKDGTRVWLEVLVCRVVENGEITGTQSAIRDISDRKKAENLLEAQNRELKKINSELDQFVYSISHDLRAPLLSVLGLVDLCRFSQTETELNENYDMILKSVDRIDGTIKEILAYSRNTHQDIVLQQIDFDQELNGILKSIRDDRRFAYTGCEIDISSSAPFYSDKARVGKVLKNLISNAFIYQKENSQAHSVKISVETNSNECLIVVADNGEGISEDKHEKIFEMFYRNSEKSEGSGLGLYICREILNKLGGEIRLSSVPGEGSTFFVRLPNLYAKNK